MLKSFARALAYLLLFAIMMPLGITWHEVMGHGLTGLLCGGRATRLQVLGFELYPKLRYTGLDEGLGACDIAGITSDGTRGLMMIGGSGSMLFAAAVAVVLLWRWRPRGWKRVALSTVGLWSLDLLTFMLPSFGLRRYYFTGTTYSEPYQGAQLLGIAGPTFQWVAVGLSVLVLTGMIVANLTYPRRPERR